MAPAELLLKMARKLVMESSGTELVQQMRMLRIGYNPNPPDSPAADEVQSSDTHLVTRWYERIEGLDWVEKLNNHFFNLTGIVAKTVKKMTEDRMDVAQKVEDFSKIIPGGLSSIFHLIVLGMRLASMFAVEYFLEPCGN